MSATYSFLDVKASIKGPGGAFSLGSGAGVAEEGISIDPSEDINTMTIGADGSPMHSLHANKSGRITLHLLKTSPTNALLSNMVELQRTSSALHGVNILTISNPQTGDQITCQQVAFGKIPSNTYAKEGGTIAWEFHAGIIDQSLAGLLLSIANQV